MAGDRAWRRTAILASPLLVAAFAGCADAGAAEVPAKGAASADTGWFLSGLVLDAEIVPVADALVIIRPGDLNTTTATDGTFRLGPLADGDYELNVTKQGYAGRTVAVSIFGADPERVRVTLNAIAANVPYHETHVFVAYIFCTLTVGGTFAPCVPVNVLTGQNVTQDRAEFNFRIPRAGLMDLLHEMTWLAQTTGRDMSVTIRPPSLALVVGGVTDIYLSKGGSSPLRSWVTPGQINEGATKPFDANETKQYTTIIRGRSTNSTTGQASIFLDHRVNNYFTFFYNRAGPRDFTVIPDG